MNSIQNWTKAKLELKQAKDWVSNEHKIDSQCGSNYSLRVSLGNESIQWNGQAYCGATNYHTAEKPMIRAMEQAIKLCYPEILRKALQILENDANSKAILAKDEIEAALAEIGEISE